MLIMASIWVFRYRWPAALWITAGYAAASLLAHRDTPETLGLRWPPFRDAMVAWWPAIAVWGAAVAAVIAVTGPGRHFTRHAFGYYAWCVVQQLLLQNLVYARLRSGFGAGRFAVIAAAALFAAAHVPNPILVPATFLWGVVSVLIFERRRSVWAIALLQTLLSALLLFVAPAHLSRQFRVGPGYWRAYAAPRTFTPR